MATDLSKIRNPGLHKNVAILSHVNLYPSSETKPGGRTDTVYARSAYRSSSLPAAIVSGADYKSVGGDAGRQSVVLDEVTEHHLINMNSYKVS